LVTLLHYFLHLLFPGILARVFFRERWLWVWGLLLATMLVDADHLLARPIFDPDRCSIGFHPLHSLPFLWIYPLGLLWKPTRILALGLCLHMLTDGLDCYLH
jgi:hypothetical protein